MGEIVHVKKRSRQADDTEFLPAALEIVETPPSPTGRAMAYAIVALFCAALAWSLFGQVDIIASAKGKIVPSGRSKVIQPFEMGVVRAIHVHDGQTVKAGETLIELDPTMNAAESRHYQNDLTAAQLDVARLRALLSDGDPIANFQPPANAPLALVTVQRKFLADQVDERRAKLAIFDRLLEQKQAERATISATIDKLGASLPILGERLEIRKTLYEHDTGSKVSYLELLQQYVADQRELDVQKHRYEESVAAVAAAEEQRVQAVKEFRGARYAEFVEAERKVGNLEEDLVRAQHRANLQVLTAPIDGTVQQLAVHTVGGVVTPAQSLLVVVPRESRLEILAMVANRDIGFVHAGQRAQIKVDAFNFDRYGLVGGTVESVSRDAIARDRLTEGGKAPQTSDADNNPGESGAQELAYAARISLDSAQMRVDDRLVELSPGMAVTVEIKTGSRRIITYLLSPLLKLKQDALRER